MAIVCSSPNVPTDPDTGQPLVTVNPTPDAVTGACTWTADDTLPEGTYNFTLIKTDDATGTQVDECPVELSCAPVQDSGNGGDGLTKADVVACIEQYLAENPQTGGGTGTGSPLSCYQQSLVFEQCGNDFVFADWDGDGIARGNIAPEFVPYAGVAPDNSTAVIVPTLDAYGNPSGVMPITKYAVSESSGCVTHIADCGTWRGIASTKDLSAEPGFGFFCLPDYTYPLQINSQTSGVTIGGVFYPFNLTRPDKSETGCPTAYEKFVWPNTTGTPLPDIRPPTVFIQGGSGTYCDTIWDGGHTNNAGGTTAEVAYAMGYPIWTETGGPCTTQDTDCIILGFDLNTRVSDIGVGLKVRNSVVWADVVSVTPPPGAVLGVHYELHAGHVRIKNPASPLLATPQRWEIKFQPQNATPANGSFDSLFWAMSGPAAGATDSVARLRMTAIGPAPEPSVVVNGPTDLVGLLNPVDPNSDATWVVQGDSVCVHAPTGLAGQYTAPQLSLNI